ncbi:unnamed protein product, partial [Linum tenue]
RIVGSLHFIYPPSNQTEAEEQIQAWCLGDTFACIPPMSYPLSHWITNSSCHSTALPSSFVNPPLQHPGRLPISIFRFSRRIYIHELNGGSPARLPSPPLLCSIKADNNAYDLRESGNSHNHEGSGEKDDTGQGSFTFNSKEILKKLSRYGVSGVLAYGLLNTAYYLTTFLFVWLYVAPAPGKMGFSAAAESLQVSQSDGHGMGWKPSY